MRARGGRNLACAAGVALAALLAGGCHDDFPPPGGDGLLVEVYDVTTARPVPGVKVLVMDLAANVPLRAPAVTNGAGYVMLDVYPGDDRAVLVFGGADWRMYGAASLAWKAVPPEVLPLTPPARMLELAMEPADSVSGSRVSGIVRDAVSGRPLAGAFVSTDDRLLGYTQLPGPGDDVTLADGAFSVAGVRFIERTPGVFRQGDPLVVLHRGYRPRLWFFDGAAGGPPASITGQEILLEPDGDGPTGSLHGRVLLAGEPAAGVRVGLGCAAVDKASLGLPGRTALTDSAGVFAFADLPPGDYRVQPGFAVGDGVMDPNAWSQPRRTVTAGGDTDAGDVPVLHEIVPRYPPDGASADRNLRLFEWSAVPGAVSYVFALDGDEPVHLDDTYFALAPGDTLAKDDHRWQVDAVGEDGLRCGGFGRDARFMVR